MGGRPKQMAANDYLDTEVGENRVMDLRSEGKSVREICREVGTTPRLLYGWLGNQTTARRAEKDGLCRRDRWADATALGADSRAALADERLEKLLDPETGRMRPDVSREEVALAKALSDQDRWQAGNLDPKGFRPNGGLPEGGVVQINIGKLFQQVLSAPVARPALPAAPIEEAEVVEPIEEEDDE